MKIVLDANEKRILVIVAVVFVVAVLGTGFVTTEAANYVNQQTSLKASLESEIVDIRGRLQGIEGEREAVRANRENYLRWVEAGVVGPQGEERVNWVKAMRQIGLEKGLFPADYKFDSAPTLLDPTASPFTEQSSVQISLWKMNIDMAMLHDLDALLFLEILNRRVDSFFFPIECSFALNNRGEFILERRENMSANCSLIWVSAQDPSSTVIPQ